jgi:hypothetical protein
MILNRLKLAPDDPVLAAQRTRLDGAFDLVEARTGRGALARGRRLHRRRHHDGLLAHHHAVFPAL